MFKNEGLDLQHDLTPRIYVLHKLKAAAKLSNRVKFKSYINWKFRQEVHHVDRIK